jgi:hypothetical protein
MFFQYEGTANVMSGARAAEHVLETARRSSWLGRVTRGGEGEAI